MNPKIKLAMLICVSVSMVAFPNLLFVSCISAACVALIAFFRLGRAFLPWLKTIIIVSAVVVAVQLLTLGGGFMTLEALARGALYSLRLFSLLSAVFLFTQTTKTSRLPEAFSFLPRSLRHVFVLSLALIPQVTELAGKVIAAQKARGLSFRTPNVARTYAPVMVPIFAKMLEKSERMALAMEARGFGESDVQGQPNAR
jgi:energy-coupling factor transport system permease protein